MFAKKLTKGKGKKMVAAGMVLFLFLNPIVPPAGAGVLPAPPAIHILSPFEHKVTNQDFHPRVAAIPESKVDKIKLTTAQIKQLNNLAFQVKNNSITMEEAVLQLRGGEGFTDVAAVIAFVVFMNWYDSLFGVEAFKIQPLPHQDPFGWFSGKYNSKNAGNQHCLTHPPSRFERETLDKMKQMCVASPDENNCVMTYDEAYKLVKETYCGSIRITEECSMSAWQCAKKAYHFQKGFNIDLNNYENISKEDLVTLQKTDGGLIPYVQKGGKLPPIELIKDCQQKIYEFCHLDNTEINRNVKHYGKNTGETSCIMFFNRETRQIALFNKTSGDLITAEKFRQGYFNKCVNSGQIGRAPN